MVQRHATPGLDFQTTCKQRLLYVNMGMEQIAMVLHLCYLHRGRSLQEVPSLLPF